ncbi:MAG TPA: M14 family zinc carboxypeptidase [Rhodanobacteraceae bacterium]|nr:M14 family zinc carboxypeptidase [Rhodanobacteraceae bacterium]
MHSRIPLAALAALLASITVASTLATAADSTSAAAYARDPAQPIDEAYTAKIREYTTDPQFNTPLTDYLPAAPGVPTPRETLGYISGAPDHLPHSADVYKYFRDLAKASPRVKVYTIGKTEEGREMIAVAIADENLLADREANDARLAKLADPRTIGMDDAKASELIAASTPVYYITGTIHSTETGAPTALMELAYRLAVDDAPYIRKIRSSVITLITPIVEVDGRDRMADLYAWHKAHPDQNYSHLLYWGHYVAHDNNRDAMGMTLALTRNVLDTYLGWHAQVLHDLHESVPFLYDNTVGDGPYNAWMDPILVGEWQQIGWDNVQQMTKLGMPGVFTHGDFDTWSPGYLMFLAATHNGISRLYETFGNGGADTVERILEPDEYARTWYRPNPPLPKVTWSQRNNNNYEQTGLLTALNYFADNGKQFLDGFWRKGKRSIEKPADAGPAAYVIAADDAHRGARSRLLNVLQLQHCELSRLDAPADILVDAPKKPDSGKDDAKADDSKKDAKPAKQRRTFPAGSIVVRMDQPYSRVADALLDRQYWAPGDPQKHPYDDTGWSFGPLFGVDVVRVTDPAILKASMTKLDARVEIPAGLAGIDVPAAKLPRIALLHTWISTQTEGWWRMALDQLGVKYDYISTQDVAKSRNLRGKYDVILFGPVSYADTDQIVNGLPMYGPPLPWKTTKLTPNLGRIDETDDIRPGLGPDGVANLQAFVRDGGLLITSENTATLAIELGMAPGVSVAPSDKVKVVGSVLRGKLVDKASPIARGYGDEIALYSARGESFKVSDVTAYGNFPNQKDYKRPTGRGGPDDVDAPEGRALVEAPPLPDPKPWQATPLNVDQARNNPFVIPAGQRPRVIVRWGDAKDLLISGLLDGAGDIAERAAVVEAHYGKGHVLLFANNPLWRGETIGSWPLVFNAIVNFDRLDAATH